jgi:hypothetical protein
VSPFSQYNGDAGQDGGYNAKHYGENIASGDCERRKRRLAVMKKVGG